MAEGTDTPETATRPPKRNAMRPKPKPRTAPEDDS